MNFDSRAFRARWGFSQAVFARLLGLADGRTVRRWEGKEARQPQVWVMRRIRELEEDLERKLMLRMEKNPKLPQTQKNRLPPSSKIKAVGIVPSSFL